MDSKQWLALKASAGSGKTFSLAMRYISLLLNGANPNEILTLTFTKKAATEMKKRIHDNLFSLKENKNAQNLIDELKKEYNIDVQEIEKNIPLIYQRFLSANVKIMTIDSFLQSILKKFCWHAGVKHNFEVEFDDKDKNYETFLSSLIQVEFSEFSEFCIKQNIQPKTLFELLDKMNTENFDPKDYMIETPKNIFFEEILQIAQKIQNVILKEKNASNSAKKTIKIEEYKNFNTFIKTSLTWLEKGNDFFYFKALNLSCLEQDFETLRELVRQCYQYRESLILSKISDFLKLYKKSKAKLTNNTLNFQDITLKTYELLQNHFERDFFYFRLDDKITHILIDEFQDTSIIQYKILKPIIDEIYSGEGRFEQRSIFFVGDTKQSIYRFRGSNPALFDIASKNITKKNLQYNYRSNKNIIDYVNKIFDSKIEGYTPQNFPNKNTSYDGFVKICTPNEDIYAYIWDNLDLLIQNNIALEDIVILCFKNEDGLNIKNYLLSKNPNLPIITKTNKKLIEQNESKIIIHSIDYSKTKSEFYKKSALKLAGLSYNTDIQMPIAKDFSTPQEFILKIMETFNLYSEAAQKMLEISCDYNDLDEFYNTIGRLENDFALEFRKGLQIMTIHNSKGLEFPYVILCDRMSGEPNNKDKLIFDYDGIELKKIFYKQNNRELFDTQYKLAKEKENQAREKEEKNVLYVAFTRGIEGLIIIQKESKSAFKILDLKTEEIGSIKNQKKSKNQKIKPKPIIIEQKNFGRQVGFIKQEENPQQYSSADIVFGQALHKALECDLGYNITEEKIFNILTNEYGYFLPQKNIQYILHLIEKLKKNEMFKSIISEALIKSEISYLDNGSLNRIDAMLLNTNNRMFILDYKSGIKNQDKHKEQVKKYLEFTKTQWENIEAYILYVREKIEFIPIL
ncbi:RecB-like helicase [Helicobacter sp. 13S00477-4]|uniref:RecB-like helicase n=1 Tax=Helicobacter sp. 13S00477-4 TaxID=1905759 RepID=UPI000BA558A0|nr:RecB-like helicase [Helicobacter sp. 13S00477-4]PAF51030.1 hypothetical protein BKH44_06440 [Helicobacter sp. 13S00477-4]